MNKMAPLSVVIDILSKLTSLFKANVVHHYNFRTMLLNLRYIILITCLLLFSKINLYLSVCFVVLLILIFYALLCVFIFLFCILSCSQIGFMFLFMCVLKIAYLIWLSLSWFSISTYLCLLLCSFSWRCLFFCEFWTYNTYISTLHTTYIPPTLESSPTFLAYYFITLPNQHPCPAICCTPTDPPLAHIFCNHFLAAQPCHTITIWLFFQWSLCRNMFLINRSCF